MPNKRRRLNSEVKPSTTPEPNGRPTYASRPRATKNQHSRYKDIEIDFILELAYNYQLPNSSIILLYKACFAHKAKEIFGDTQVNYVKTIYGGKGENKYVNIKTSATGGISLFTLANKRTAFLPSLAMTSRRPRER